MLALHVLQVLKQDWPQKWPSFVPDLVGASKTSETLCENSMVILKLLSEEVFDFSRGELTQVPLPRSSAESGGRGRGAPDRVGLACNVDPRPGNVREKQVPCSLDRCTVGDSHCYLPHETVPPIHIRSCFSTWGTPCQATSSRPLQSPHSHCKASEGRWTSSCM